jgi:F0F1-type ATP synthase alpha subunit
VFKSKDHAFNRVERSSLVSFYQLFSNGNARYGLRHFHPSPLRHAKKLPSDANETLVEQQLLSYIQSGDDDDEKKDEKVTLPLVGVVLDVKNNIASISGLRNATIGSVVHITSDIDIVARGVVLFLERKITHVALFSEYSAYASEVQIGMDAKLVADELSISTSFDMLKGKVVDALGSPISLSHYEEESKESNQTPGKALEDISISWGSKSVPGFMQREQLKYPFRTGIHAIDLLKPLAYGHRFGILGPR